MLSTSLVIHTLLGAALLLAGCGADSAETPDAFPTACTPGAPAPTYSELYTRYFASGTPGHCANAGCHANPDYVQWLCGPDKNTCYQGMVTQGLINMSNPIASLIGDPRNSPLSWINPSGPMPQDRPGSFPEGRTAILAWIAACAPNN